MASILEAPAKERTLTPEEELRALEEEAMRLGDVARGARQNQGDRPLPISS